MTLPEQPTPPHTSPSSTSTDGATAQGGSSVATTPSDGTPTVRSFFKTNHFSWKILGGIFATILVVCWVFIIVILIQEEKWQLVLVAWLLLYAAAHFCYWYFKRHHLLSLHSQICGRTRGNVGSVRPIEKGPDAPPSYDDIIKSEGLPPTYYSVVKETSKTAIKSPPPNKFPIFSLQGFPEVFRRGSSPPSLNSVSSSAQEASTSTANCSSSSPMSKRKGIPSSSSFPSSPPSSISGSIPHRSYSFKSVGRYADPPSYYDSMADVESQVISPHHSLPPSPSRRMVSRSVSRQESVVDEALHPIFSPIYNNSATYNSNSNNNNNCYYNNNNNHNSNNNNNSTSDSPPTRPNTSLSSRESSNIRSCMVQVEREKDCSTPNA